MVAYEHHLAFGEHTGLDLDIRGEIDQIRDNANDFTQFEIGRYDADQFTNLAWRLLGRYIAPNTHLQRVVLDECGITDEIMALLFEELVSSLSVERLDLDSNHFGIDGVRSMIPFLQNTPKFSILYLGLNSNINTECFELLISALDGKSVKELDFCDCNITDISALETYSLPNLDSLSLTGNNIGREGITTLSIMLQKEDTRLTKLELKNTKIDDEDAEILAASLKHNSKLKTLVSNNNNITEKGLAAFLKLLNDISSIDNTYDSNHTLTNVKMFSLPPTNSKDNMLRLINRACKYDDRRAKVISTQFNSENRKELCQLQGIEYSPGSIFADIEPIILPNILTLIGERNGQGELYTALVHTAPDLMSFIDRKALIDGEMAKLAEQMSRLSQQMSALSVKNDQLSKRREMIEQGLSGQKQSMTDGDKKRKVQY